MASDLPHEELELVYVLQCYASTLGYRMQRILVNMERNLNLVCETTVKTTEKCTATSEPDTVFHDVGIELWRSLLKSLQYGSLNLCDSLSMQCAIS